MILQLTSKYNYEATKAAKHAKAVKIAEAAKTCKTSKSSKTLWNLLLIDDVFENVW